MQVVPSYDHRDHCKIQVTETPSCLLFSLLSFIFLMFVFPATDSKNHGVAPFH